MITKAYLISFLERYNMKINKQSIKKDDTIINDEGVFHKHIAKIDLIAIIYSCFVMLVLGFLLALTLTTL